MKHSKNCQTATHLKLCTLVLAMGLCGTGFADAQTVCNGLTSFNVEAGDSCSADQMPLINNTEFKDGVWVRQYLQDYLDSTNRGTITNININGGSNDSSGVVGVNTLANDGTVTKMINVGFPWSDYYWQSNRNIGRVNNFNNTGSIQQGIAIHSFIGNNQQSSIGNLVNTGSIMNSGFAVTNLDYTYTFGLSLWYNSFIDNLDNSGFIKSTAYNGTGIYLFSEQGGKITYINNLLNRANAEISGSNSGIDLTGRTLSDRSEIVALNNSGLISGGNNGVVLRSSSRIDTLINNATGELSTTGSFGRGISLLNSSRIGMLNNSGLIKGSRAVELDDNSSIGTLTNLNTGLIVADRGESPFWAAISLGWNNHIQTINNYGEIRGATASITADQLNVAISVTSGSRIDSLNNFSTGSIGTIVNGGEISSLNNNGVLSDIWNVSTSASLKMSINNSGRIGSLINLQGPGNSAPLLYQGVLPANYSIWISGQDNYGQLVADAPVSGRMTFNVSSGNEALTYYASTVAIANDHLYEDVLTGISLGNLSGRKDGTVSVNGADYRWMLLRDATDLTSWDLCFGNICPDAVPNYAPLAGDTLNSFFYNANSLRNAFNLQYTKIAQGLSYDCTVYDKKNICVSFVGSKSDGRGFDATTGALIIAHKPTNHLRFGGYIDQSFGSDTSGGLTVKKGNPGFGVFGVWTQNPDGSGVQVRAAANMGKVGMESQREAIDSAEAGFGKSNIKSQGFQLEVSKDYAINSMWSARPYLGYRKTTNKRAGYTETDSVDFPLEYSSLKQTTETLTAGATFAQTLSAKTTMFLTAGVEHDLKNSIGRYAAANDDIGDIDSIYMSSNKRKIRPTVSFALNHDIDKTQRIGVSLTHRKEAFASGSTTSAQLQYSKGF
jgi:hypothetical protein